MGSSSYSLQMASLPLPRSLPQWKQTLLFLHTTSGLRYLSRRLFSLP